jgi:hypothetical protein
LLGGMQDALMEVALRKISRVDSVSGSKTSIVEVQQLGGAVQELTI